MLTQEEKNVVQDVKIARQSETISQLEETIAEQQKTIEEQHETIQRIAKLLGKFGRFMLAWLSILTTSILVQLLPTPQSHCQTSNIADIIIDYVFSPSSSNQTLRSRTAFTSSRVATGRMGGFLPPKSTRAQAAAPHPLCRWEEPVTLRS